MVWCDACLTASTCCWPPLSTWACPEVLTYLNIIIMSCLLLKCTIYLAFWICMLLPFKLNNCAFVVDSLCDGRDSSLHWELAAHTEHHRVCVDIITWGVDVKSYSQLSWESFTLIGDSFLCPVLRESNSTMHGNLLVVVIHHVPVHVWMSMLCRLFMKFARLVCGNRKFVTTRGLQNNAATCLLIFAIVSLPSRSVTKGHVFQLSNALLINAWRVT